MNVAIGKWYPRGQDRLAESLREVGYTGATAFWQELPPGSPSHSDVPYAFKLHALRSAAKNHDVLLYVDASVWFVRSPDPVFDRVERDGYYLTIVPGSHYVGEWSTDRALENLYLTRDDAMAIPIVTGGFFGVDLRTSIGRGMLKWQEKHARDGSFAGDWTNERGQASADPRCKGHRHDQPSLSLLAWNRGLKVDGPSGFFVYHAHAKASARTVAFTRGME